MHTVAWLRRLFFVKWKATHGQLVKLTLWTLRNQLSPLASYETLEKLVTLSQLPICKAGITFFLLTKRKHTGNTQVALQRAHWYTQIPWLTSQNFWKHLIAASYQLDKLFLHHLRLVSSDGFPSFLITAGIAAPTLTVAWHKIWNPSSCSNS